MMPLKDIKTKDACFVWGLVTDTLIEVMLRED